MLICSAWVQSWNVTCKISFPSAIFSLLLNICGSSDI
jgi:hypothetical protein